QAGVCHCAFLDEVFFELPHVRAFVEERGAWRPAPHRRLLAAMLETYREWGGEKQRPRIAIVDWTGGPTESELGLLATHFECERYPTVSADPHDIPYEGGVLWADGAPIDILYKRVVIHELLE